MKPPPFTALLFICACAAPVDSGATLAPTAPHRLSVADRDRVLVAACGTSHPRGTAIDPVRFLGTRDVSVAVRCAPTGTAIGLPSYRRAHCDNRAGRWSCSVDGPFVDYPLSSGAVTLDVGAHVDIAQTTWAIDALDRLQVFYDAVNVQYVPLRLLLTGAVCRLGDSNGAVRELLCDAARFRYRVDEREGQAEFTLLSADPIFV